MEHACLVCLGFLLVLQQATSTNFANVMVDEDAYWAVRAQDNAGKMPDFVRRVVQLFGGRVEDVVGLNMFAEKYNRADSRFEDMMSEVARHPKWAIWDEYAACVSDRGASAEVVGKGIAYACSHMRYFDCKKVPVHCTTAESNIWTEADYIFSVFFNERVGAPYPTCYMSGAAIFQPASTYLASAESSGVSCTATQNPLTTPVTDEGYHAVISQKNSTKTRAFISRLASSQSLGPILNEKQLVEWSENPPQDFQSLRDWLPVLRRFSLVTPSGASSFGPSWTIILLTICWILPCLGLSQ